MNDPFLFLFFSPFLLGDSIIFFNKNIRHLILYNPVIKHLLTLFKIRFIKMKSVHLQNIVKSKHQSGDGVTKIFKYLNGKLSLSTIKRWVKMINETGSIKLRNSPGSSILTLNSILEFPRPSILFSA